MKFIRILKASIITDEDLTARNKNEIYDSLRRAYNLFDVDINIDEIFDYLIDNMGYEFHSFETKDNNFIITTVYGDKLDADGLYDKFRYQDSYHRPFGN